MRCPITGKIINTPLYVRGTFYEFSAYNDSRGRIPLAANAESAEKELQMKLHIASVKLSEPIFKVISLSELKNSIDTFTAEEYIQSCDFKSIPFCEDILNILIKYPRLYNYVSLSNYEEYEYILKNGTQELRIIAVVKSIKRAFLKYGCKCTKYVANAYSDSENAKINDLFDKVIVDERSHRYLIWTDMFDHLDQSNIDEILHIGFAFKYQGLKCKCQDCAICEDCEDCYRDLGSCIACIQRVFVNLAYNKSIVNNLRSLMYFGYQSVLFTILKEQKILSTILRSGEYDDIMPILVKYNIHNMTKKDRNFATRKYKLK
jgi:hypothetical protein